jgi:hypothetical protein
MSPLDEDLSFHIRGPAQLKQFAVYVPGVSNSKLARRSPHADAVKHGHQHFHAKRSAETPAPVAARDAAPQDYITATINGQVVSWPNEQYQAAPTPAAAPAVPPPAYPPGHQKHGKPKHNTPDYNKKPVVPAHTGDWVRTAYYNAEKGIADGVTFLNNKGGSASGVFDYQFGNSLGYVGCDGIENVASSQVLKDVLIPSNEEVIIMSDKPCKNGDCGYTRPGGVAYHGFGGANKAFFMEFSMPDDGKTGWNENMPAIWMLNGQIPRTLQYGKAECSCWTSGCGEVDIFEVLDSGNHRMKSTLHGYFQGGDSDWFQRPTEGTIKAAVVFDDESIHMQILDDGQSFGRSMSPTVIDDICGNHDELLSSIFSIAVAA